MNISRRRFLETWSLAAVSLGSIDFTGTRYRTKGVVGEGNVMRDGPDVWSASQVLPFARRAVEAAMAAGASYADARIIRIVNQGLIFRDETISRTEFSDRESIGFGVRVLVKGCFGFAASPYLDLDEASLLAQGAVEQAKANAAIRPRELHWTPAPTQTGRWVSPADDPFLVPIEERVEFINAWREDVKRYRDGANLTKLIDSNISFGRTEKFLVTSEGTAVSQVLYKAGGMMAFVASSRFHQMLTGPYVGSVKGIDAQQGGWEVFTKAKPREQIPQLVAQAIENSQIGLGIFDVGRYDLVLDGSFTGSLVSQTFGKSTQLDVALGYEANAGGTSYLGPDPSEFLGTSVAHPLVSIHCDRDAAQKLSTVKWDDEGITPSEFDLVRNGVLVNYQASRETSAKLNALLQKSTSTSTRPLPSAVVMQGCASAQTGLHLPLQSTPNLTMAPNPSPCSVSDMVSQVKRGYLIYNGTISTTFNVREGVGIPGMVREIRDGKLKEFIPQFHVIFNTPEIWKSIQLIGDATTTRRSQGRDSKGEPSQIHSHSVDAVAILAKDVALIDPKRKA